MPTFNTEKGTGLGLIIAKGDIQLLDGVFHAAQFVCFDQIKKRYKKA